MDRIVAKIKVGILKKEVIKPINQFLLQYFQNLSPALNNCKHTKEDSDIKYLGNLQNMFIRFIVRSITPKIANMVSILSSC